MLEIKNIGQRQVAIKIDCPHCGKAFEHTLIQLPYPCYEATNEIDSERYREESIRCPHCEKILEGTIYATREMYYIEVDGLSSDDEDNDNINRLYAIWAWTNAHLFYTRLLESINQKENDNQLLQDLSQKYIANLKLFISLKEMYPSQRKKMEDLEDVVDRFMQEHWNSLNLIKEADDIAIILINFLKDTDLIMSQWHDEEMSIILKDYI